MTQPSTESWRTRVAQLAFILSAILISSASNPVAAEETGAWKAGFAQAVITPENYMWMSGYGNRDRPAEGKIHDLYAKVAVLEDPSGKRAVFIATDLITVPIKMANFLSEGLQKKYGLPRSQLMITCSHTHSGPALDDTLSHMLAMNEEDWVQVRAYSARLNQRILELVDTAIKDVRPARLATGKGKTTFANNRRSSTKTRPVDHEVPVLRAMSADGKQLRGVIFGYACHNTVLSDYEWCGDYAGFATADFEDKYPGSVALFFTGCGADQNPLPRRKLELAQKYGRMLAQAVEAVVEGEMQPVTGMLKTRFQNIELEFAQVPTREEIEDKLENGSRYEQNRARNQLAQLKSLGRIPSAHAYPIQVWQLGNDLTWIALGGEIVVDYALRLKNELGEENTWVTGYANHVMCYIPSERVLAEGGYEGGTSMVYYQLPSKWKPGLEDKIVGTVHKLVKQTAGDTGR